MFPRIDRGPRLAIPAPSLPLRSYLLTDWRGWPGSGLTLFDHSRYRNHATFKAAGEPAWVQLPSGLWVMRFDGVDDRVVATKKTTQGLAAMTLLAWVKPTDGSRNYTIFGDYTGAGDATISFECDDVAATGTWKGNIYLDSEGTIATNNIFDTTTLSYATWYLIAATWEPTTVKGYINGVLDKSAVYGGTRLEPAVTSPTVIGAYQDASGVQNFKGDIGIIWILNCVLTEGGILAFYEETKALFGL